MDHDNYKKFLQIIVLVLLLGTVIYLGNNFLHFSSTSAATQLSLSPVVGAVTDTQAAIYVRTNAAAQIQIQYSLNQDLSNSLVSPQSPLQTLAQDDFTGHIFLTDLTPETTYYFSVNVDGVASPTKNFKTFPTPDSQKDFGFLVLADSRAPSSQVGVYQKAYNENPEFALQIGDFSHNDPGNSTQTTPGTWWTNNRNALISAFWGLNFPGTTSIPLMHTWDDHDYGTNNADGTAWFKPLATKAFKDYFPTYPLPNEQNGLWHSFRYAQTEFFMLDLRSQKDPLNSSIIDPNKSMMNSGDLTDDQKTWFKNALLASTAKWKFVISSVSWNPTVNKPESWYGYQIEQNEIRDFIQSNNISNVMFFSADIHSSGGIDDGTNAYFPEVTIPNTNVGPLFECTGNGNCGTWSAGVINPSATIGGYLTVQVNAESLDLTIKDYYGRTLKTANLDSAGVMTSTDFPFDPALHSISITSPNTAVSWSTGSSQLIKWTHDFGNTKYPATVELSRDNGATWEILATNVTAKAMDGTYSWMVSGPVTNQARIRISAANGTVSDLSNSAFTITSPSVTVTSGNTNVNWALDSAQKITWNHNLPKGSSFRVDLSRDDGATWEELAASVAGSATSGTYTWTVAGNLSTQTRIKVTANASGLSDINDAPFTLGTPFITVTSPNKATDVWTVGKSKKITWNSNLGGAEKVKIELSKDGGQTYPITISASTPSDGSQSFPVQSGWVSTNERVKITWIGNVTKETFFDTSDADFITK